MGALEKVLPHMARTNDQTVREVLAFATILLFNANRNPWATPEAIEQVLHDALGTRHVVWLPGGIDGDDTDGHIDDVARFVNATTVAVVVAPEGHADHAVTQRNLAAQ